MLAKTIALLATAALAGFAMKLISDARQAKPARVKPNPHNDGRVRRLRKDPETGEYYPVD